MKMTMKWIISTNVSLVVIFTSAALMVNGVNGDIVDTVGEGARKRRDNTVYGSYYYKGVSILTRWCENFDLQFHFMLECNRTYMPKCCELDLSVLHKRQSFCAGTELGYRYPFIYNFYNICAYFYHMCILYKPDDLMVHNYPCIFPIESIRRGSSDCDKGKLSRSRLFIVLPCLS